MSNLHKLLEEIIGHARANTAFTGLEGKEARANIKYEVGVILKALDTEVQKVLNTRKDIIITKSKKAEDLAYCQAIDDLRAKQRKAWNKVMGEK